MADDNGVTCPDCGLFIAQKKNLKRHLERCGVKITKDDLKNQLQASETENKALRLQLDIANKKIAELQEKIKQFKKVPAIAVSNESSGTGIGHVEGNVITNNNNVQNIINMANARAHYQDLELRYLETNNDEAVIFHLNFTQDSIIKIIVGLFVSLYGNPRHPENMTIYVNNKRERIARVCMGENNGKAVWFKEEFRGVYKSAIHQIKRAIELSDYCLKGTQMQAIKYPDKQPLSESLFIIDKEESKPTEEYENAVFDKACELKKFHQKV